MLLSKLYLRIHSIFKIQLDRHQAILWQGILDANKLRYLFEHCLIKAAINFTGTIKTVRCEYINNTTDGPNELGYVKVAWTVHKEFSTMSNFDSGIDSFEVVWECSSQPDDLYSVSACASESWFLLPVQETGFVFEHYKYSNLSDAKQ